MLTVWPGGNNREERWLISRDDAILAGFKEAGVGGGGGREEKGKKRDIGGGYIPPRLHARDETPGFYSGVNFYDRRPSLTISPARELSRACNRNRGPRDKPSPPPSPPVPSSSSLKLPFLRAFSIKPPSHTSTELTPPPFPRYSFLLALPLLFSLPAPPPHPLLFSLFEDLRGAS